MFTVSIGYRVYGSRYPNLNNIDCLIDVLIFSYFSFYLKLTKPNFRLLNKLEQASYHHHIRLRFFPLALLDILPLNQCRILPMCMLWMINLLLILSHSWTTWLILGFWYAFYIKILLILFKSCGECSFVARRSRASASSLMFPGLQAVFLSYSSWVCTTKYCILLNNTRTILLCSIKIKYCFTLYFLF